MYKGKHEKQKRSGGNAAAWAQILVFAIFLGALLVLHLALPDKNLSGREILQTAPKFSFSALFSGQFTKQAEDYANDQFPFRDRWITLKARSELLSGKAENNGVFLCADETLIEPFTAPEPSELQTSLDAVDALAQHAGVPVYFALIPTAAELWGDMLPDGAPNDSQRETIDAAYAAVSAAGVKTIDVYAALVSHKDEPLYYRTDHHWTTLGAYYGYTAIAETMNDSPVPLDAYTERVVTEAFYGTTWSASGFSWVKPDRITAYVEQGDAVITNYPQGAPVAGTLYDESYLSAVDKYAYFYGGNTPLLTVDTGNAGLPKLLILRDSYMDSLSPFLFAHFSEIHILDLRYYRASLKAYLEEQDFDAVLVCYSVKNFVEDNSIFLAGY